MAVVVAANGTDDQAAAAAAAAAAIAGGNARRSDVDPRLLMAARCGNSELLKNLLLLLNKDVDVEAGSSSLLPRVTMEGDSLLHVVAACGGGEEYLHCAKMIVSDRKHKGGAAAVRLALEARNSKGDTPLHCAAAAGNAHMITCLVALITSNNDDDDTTDDDEAAAVKKAAFLRMQNECGETALHQAIRAADNKNKVDCIDQLMDVDPELACIPFPREEEDADAGAGAGAGALYLAISLGEIEIAKYLYVKSKGKLSYSGPDGRNVLHAAVPRGQALPMILGWLINKEDVKPREDGCVPVGLNPARPLRMCNTTHAPATARISRSVPAAAGDHCLLLTQLTSQRDNQQKGSTPLHLAVSLEGWSDSQLVSARRLLPTGIRRVSVSATALLLDANESTAYQADDQGWYPIHVAAHAGSLAVVKLLLERCPDCATLRDGEGRTFLHVAADKGRRSVVRYVCRQMPRLLPSMILNAQDSNGDTALHGAIRAGNLAVFNCLFRNRQVRLDVANKDGMTPLDLSYTMIPAGFNYTLNPRSIVRSSLLAAGAPHGGDRPELFLAKHIPKRDLDKESKMHTEATHVMSIVAALIATVTFASAFTLPGGYRGDGSGSAAGTPVLAAGKSYAFEAFILADMLAFIFSMAATCFLVYAGVPPMDISIRNWYFNISALLLQSATRSLAPAIALGLYLVLAPVDGTIAVAVCVIVFATSVYGNMASGQIIRMVRTVLARIGILRPLPTAFIVWARDIFLLVLVHFGSYVIIFGLPAIRKWVIPAILKSVHQKQL